jgi:hypothetical protein
MTAAMRRKLLEAIPKAVQKARVKEPAYCVAMVYDSATDGLPPRLAIGLDSERQAHISREGEDAKEIIWEPKKFGRYKPGKIDLVAPDLDYDSGKLLQMILMKEALWVPRRLLSEIARELAGRNWRGILPVTDDFIVYAVDVDGDDLAKNFKEGVPEAKRKLLRSRRLL